MRGQTKGILEISTLFCTGTNGFKGQNLTTPTNDYATKTVDIDFSKINDANTAATAADLATGIAISFAPKEPSKAETYFIKDVKLIEVKE